MDKNKLHKVKIEKDKGYVLVIVLIFITVFSVLSIALVSFLKNEIVMYQKMEKDIKVEYLALGGVQAYQKLKSNMVLFPIDEDPRTKIIISILQEDSDTAESTGVIDEGSEKEVNFTIKIKDSQIETE